MKKKMNLSENDDGNTCDEMFTCGEVCSPAKLEKGKIYVGGLFEMARPEYSSSVIESSENQDGNVDWFNCYSDSEEYSNARRAVRRGDFNRTFNNTSSDITFESEFSGNHVWQRRIDSISLCPQCEGLLSSPNKKFSTRVPPYCVQCKSYFISDLC